MHTPRIGAVSQLRTAGETMFVFLKDPPNWLGNFNRNVFDVNLLAISESPPDNVPREQSHCVPAINCARKQALVFVQEIGQYIALNFR